jgi:hypothetical protein
MYLVRTLDGRLVLHLWYLFVAMRISRLRRSQPTPRLVLSAQAIRIFGAGYQPVHRSPPVEKPGAESEPGLGARLALCANHLVKVPLALQIVGQDIVEGSRSHKLHEACNDPITLTMQTGIGACA